MATITAIHPGTSGSGAYSDPFRTSSGPTPGGGLVEALKDLKQFTDSEVATLKRMIAAFDAMTAAGVPSNVVPIKRGRGRPRKNPV